MHTHTTHTPHTHTPHTHTHTHSCMHIRTHTLNIHSAGPYAGFQVGGCSYLIKGTNLPIIHSPLWLSYRSSGTSGHLHSFHIHKMLLSVHAICKRILMLGCSCASHSLMASDGELGSLSAGTVLYLDFHLHISFSNSSGVGRSC